MEDHGTNLPFDATPLLEGTQDFTNQQRLLYQLLLKEYWKNGPIRNHEFELCNICMINREQFCELMPPIINMFEQDKDYLRLSYLDKLRA